MRDFQKRHNEICWDEKVLDHTRDLLWNSDWNLVCQLYERRSPGACLPERERRKQPQKERIGDTCDLEWICLRKMAVCQKHRYVGHGPEIRLSWFEVYQNNLNAEEREETSYKLFLRPSSNIGNEKQVWRKCVHFCGLPWRNTSDIVMAFVSFSAKEKR